MDLESVSAPISGLERGLPENCTQYVLLVVDSKLDTRKLLLRLEEIKKAALKLASDLAGDYIWQRDNFDLKVKHEQKLIYLRGMTDYGDSIEDEWLIVYILRELSKSFEDLWVRISDGDGEFLLVEAALSVPSWITSEIDQNRVWVHDGKLLIIPPKEHAGSDLRPLTLQEAAAVLATTPEVLEHSSSVEEQAFQRLERYPGQIGHATHHSLVVIPRRLAYILHCLPRAVAPAVEAFYLRDPLALKKYSSLASAKKLVFPPTDMVTVSVRFTKILFAQLKSQRFDAPQAWASMMQLGDSPGASVDQKTLDRQETGMKLAVGLELLVASLEKNDNRTVREVGIMVEDIEEDGDDILPTDEDIATWPDVSQDDDESWMDIDFEDFERELQGQRGAGTAGSSKGFGDAHAHETLRNIVGKFEAFLDDDTAGPEGAEFNDMDVDNDDTSEEEESGDEDEDVHLDEEKFTQLMREVLGLPPATDTRSSAKVKDAGERNKDEQAEIEELAAQMEAELGEHGLWSRGQGRKGKEPEQPTKTLTSSLQSASLEASQGIDGSSDDEALDIDYNLAKNLLESFKSQGGMAGPAGNILGMMGIQLPRDEDEAEANDKTHASTSAR